MEALPDDIRNLPKYYVPNELFVSTAILLIFFLVWTIIMAAIWIWRSLRHIHNYEYIVDHNIRREYEHAKKTYKERMEQAREEENQIFHSEISSSNQTKYSPELQIQQVSYNRQESRFLEFVCLSVVVAININAFTANIMEVIAYLVAVVLFLVFNVFRIIDNSKLRLAFFIPLIVAYVPFLVFDKQLDQLF